MGPVAESNLLQIFHININCSDLERTIAFYSLIGFHVAVDLREPVDGLPIDFAEIGLAPALALPCDLSGRAVLMAASDDPRGTTLDIIEWTSPIQTGEPRVGLAQPGVGRVALKVRDASAMHRLLVEHGARPYSEPIRVVMAGAPFLVFCVEDPDGMVVEIMQFLRGDSDAPRKP